MAAFSVGFCSCFCLAYLALLAAETPFVYYYPLHGRWSLGPLGSEQGPAITWYGLLLVALLVALAGGALASRLRPGAGVPAAVAWLPWLALLGCAWFMRPFFLAGGTA